MAPKDVFDVEIVDWYFKEQGFEILSQYARARERLSQNSACHASKRTQVQILLLLKKAKCAASIVIPVLETQRQEYSRDSRKYPYIQNK